jgi:PleD family two-component response regulator
MSTIPLGTPSLIYCCKQWSLAYKKGLREGNTLSRYGGGEFVLLLLDTDGAADAELIARKIMDVLK